MPRSSYFGVLFVLLASSSLACLHDEILTKRALSSPLSFDRDLLSRRVSVSVPQDYILEEDNVLKRTLGESKPRFSQPFRLTFNLENLDNDPYTCYKVPPSFLYRSLNEMTRSTQSQLSMNTTKS